MYCALHWTSPEPSGPAIAGAFGAKTPENNSPRVSRFSDCRGLHHDTPGMVEEEEEEQQQQQQQQQEEEKQEEADTGSARECPP